jgi:hypothetical protein
MSAIDRTKPKKHVLSLRLSDKDVDVLSKVPWERTIYDNAADYLRRNGIDNVSKIVIVDIE